MEHKSKKGERVAGCSRRAQIYISKLRALNLRAVGVVFKTTGLRSYLKWPSLKKITRNEEFFVISILVELIFLFFIFLFLSFWEAGFRTFACHCPSQHFLIARMASKPIITHSFYLSSFWVSSLHRRVIFFESFSCHFWLLYVSLPIPS